VLRPSESWAALEWRRERVEQLKRDRDVLLGSYAGMAPMALASLSTEERHGVYKMLKLRLEAFPARTCLVSGAMGVLVRASSKFQPHKRPRPRRVGAPLHGDLWGGGDSHLRLPLPGALAQGGRPDCTSLRAKILHPKDITSAWS
jgi:hypothetical protein